MLKSGARVGWIMAGFDPVVNIAIVLVAALIGGLIAHRLGQPVILGYILVGTAIGPHGLGVIKDLVLIENLATIGVVLLMFTVGLEISYGQLREVGKIGVWGGIIQILSTIAVGMLAGKFVLHLALSQAAFFGLLISMSSTMVDFKLLMERGELDSMHGRIMIAILILQDLAVVLMMVGVPLFGTPLYRLAPVFGLAIGKAALFIGVAIALGLWVLPWLLGRVAGVRSRELFLLTVLILCLGAAFATYAFGLSIAFGAFIIGLLLRESVFAHQALAEITPLRDIFATLFFVSLGMLLSPKFITGSWALILEMIAIIIVIKFAICFAITRMFGYTYQTALLVGVGLTQIGEFSFILAQAGVGAGIINYQFYSLVIASTVVTMLLTPLLLALVSRLQPTLGKLAVDRGQNRPLEVGDRTEKSTAWAPEIVLCGYGRVGRNIAQYLDELRVPYAVVEIDPEVIRELRARGVPCIYGDASNRHVLSLSGLEKAKVLIVTYPDPVPTMSTVKNALSINPKLKIVARVHRRKDVEALRRLGVSDLVSPEYEASFEFLNRTLVNLGWEQDKASDILRQMRQKQEISRPLPDGEA